MTEPMTMDAALGTYQVLVVEDDPSTRQLTINALRRKGIVCDAAAHGLEALRMVELKSYDMVVTDHNMPHLTGHDLALNLLQQEEPPQVVMFTGVLEQKDANRLLAYGVEGIAFKPVDFRVFAGKIRNLLERMPPRAQAGGSASGDPASDEN